MFPYTISQNSIIILIEGVPRAVDITHPNYNKILQAVKEGSWGVIENLIDIPKSIIKFSKGKINIVDGSVFYNGQELQNYAVDKLLALMIEGFNITPLLSFLENLMENPSYRAVSELYEFLEKGNIPITEDGEFVVYKKIRDNYTDIFSGTFSNKVGDIVEMSRNAVDENSQKTCSNGLHVCSYEYLNHFGSSRDNRVVLCKVNPKDVVAIPTDYNNTKMRVCRYEVIAEVTDKYYKNTDDLAKKTVYDTSTGASKRSGKKSKVVALRDGKIVDTFASASEAEEETGIFATNIIQVCRGSRKSAGGLNWEYVQSSI